MHDIGNQYLIGSGAKCRRCPGISQQWTLVILCAYLEYSSV